jgi:PKD repeat protein
MHSRRRLVSLLIAGAVTALAFSVGSASAEVVKDSAIHKKFGIVPTTNAPRHVGAAACIADGSDCTALTYHGGPVMHAETFYLYFWTPAGHALPSAYKAGLKQWLTEIAQKNYTPGNVFGVDQQFYDNSGPGATKRFVPYAIKNAGSLTDTNAYPASGCINTSTDLCLTDAQLAAELSSYVAAHALPTGPSTEYFIFTPFDVGSCFDAGSTQCAYTAFCGYHSFTGTAGSAGEILYANMPWAYGMNGCDTNLAFGSGYPNGDAIDPVVGVWSHEASETMTDPNLNAWYQDAGTDAGYENGDKCAYVYGAGGYGSLAGLANNGLGYFNFTFGTDQYLMQMEWDQRLVNCKKTDTDTQPAVTVTPATAAHGVSTPFTANVTDPAGVSTVSWTFGDGTATVVTTGTSQAHTYATAGTKSLTVIVTDGHGNEKKVVQTITVS